MNLWLSSASTLNLEMAGISLHGAQPVLNGVILDRWTCEVLRSDSERIELCYTFPCLSDSVFGLQATQLDTKLAFHYWVKDLPHDLVLHSFGLHLG